MKKCYKCKLTKPLNCFGKLTKSKDGLRYDCKKCRNEYRIKNKESIKIKQKKYYDKNKIKLSLKHKIYREENKYSISIQRKKYREKNKERIKTKYTSLSYKKKRNELNKKRRKNDIQFRVSQTLKSKIHKMIDGKKLSIKSKKLIGCNKIDLIKWLEYQFDSNMSWDNYGSYWHIDHVLAVNMFDMKNKKDIHICFNWKNLQPMKAFDNQSKSNKFIPYIFFNHIITLHRYIKNNSLNSEYQGLSERISWLRIQLRDGKNIKDDGFNKIKKILKPKMDNPQPSSTTNSRMQFND